MRQVNSLLLFTVSVLSLSSSPINCLQVADDEPLTPVIVAEVTSHDSVSNVTTSTSTPSPSILVSTPHLPNLPNSTLNNIPVSSTTESLEDFDNLLNVTSELQLEKVNKDEECLRQLFISDKCLKKVIFLAKDSSLPRSLDEASTYCK